MTSVKPRLSREMIIERALQLLEQDGVDAFGLRRLAAELGVSAPSLYTHVESKQDLLESVAVRVTRDVNVEVFDELEWADALSAWGCSFYECVSRHPKLIPLIAASPNRRPELLGRARKIQNGLVRGGWPAATATKISWMVRYLVLGASVTRPSKHFDHTPDTYAQYPELAHLPQMFAEDPNVDFAVFDQALRMLVSQLRSQHPTAGEVSADTDGPE